jgi:hypothetical protein
MEKIDIEFWLKQRLTECFNDSKFTQSFIDEKKEKLNGRIYKYCPVIDDIVDKNGNTIPQKQFAIENIENSVIYLSRVTNFNDPFDTYLSFSFEELIGDMATNMIKNQYNTPGIEAVMPAIIDGLLNDIDAEKKKFMDYLAKKIYEFPHLISNPSTAIQDLVLSIATDCITGNQDAIEFSKSIASSTFTTAMFLRAVIYALKKYPQMLENPDLGVPQVSLEQIQSFLGSTATNNNGTNEIQEQIITMKKALREIEPEVSIAIVNMRKTLSEMFYIACFTTCSNNALMWAHYANKHKGFCVEYDLAHTKSSTFLVNLNPVLYSKKRPTVPMSLFDYTDLKNIKISTNNLSIADLILALLKKSDIWQYEEEWRLILYDKAGKELVENKFCIDCISKIILGCNMESKFENILIDICKNKGLHLSKMILDEKEYKLTEQIVF